MDEYYTVSESFNSSIEIKKSVFICSLFPINSENEAREKLANVKKEHFKANHNCYAYIIDENGLTKRFSDDREPSGTAGRPILSILENNDLVNVLCVVTRYFGGIKLGVGGLNRAYQSAVLQTLNASKIIKIVKKYKISFRADYSMAEKLISALKSGQIIPDDISYGEEVSVVLSVKKEDIDYVCETLTSVSMGSVKPIL